MAKHPSSLVRGFRESARHMDLAGGQVVLDKWRAAMQASPKDPRLPIVVAIIRRRVEEGRVFARLGGRASLPHLVEKNCVAR